MREELSQWTRATIDNPARPGEKIPRLQKEAANKMSEWLSSELRDWGHFARRALFRLSDSGGGGREIFLCVAGRAHRLYGEFPKFLRPPQGCAL